VSAVLLAGALTRQVCLLLPGANRDSRSAGRAVKSMRYGADLQQGCDQRGRGREGGSMISVSDTARGHLSYCFVFATRLEVLREWLLLKGCRV
jgi:hypothetical protein